MKSLIINKEDLRHNINVIKKQAICNEKYNFIGIVKGNGYGLGLIEYSKFLLDNGIETLGVATTEEAIELREAGIKEEILMLSSTCIKEEIEKLIEKNITLTIDSLEMAETVSEIAETKDVKAHIKIDTGFGRYGFLYNDIDSLIKSIYILKNVELEGIYTHLSLAYYKNNKWTNTQYNRFLSVIKILYTNNISFKKTHICNSPAFLNYSNMHLNCSRIGSAFLGRVDSQNDIGLKKIGKLKANITEIKTVPKGYNIGYLN